MKIKTIQWNIGGGKLLKEGEDPTLIASYSLPGIDQIAGVIKIYDPDIVTLNEVQCDNNTNQAQTLSQITGLNSYYFHEFSDSHIEPENRLGMAIISKFPVTMQSFEVFFNPKYQVIWEDDSDAISYDKGIITVALELSNKQRLIVQTLHLIPFRRFNIEPLSDETLKFRGDVESKIDKSSSPYLLQGDFNFDNASLKEFLPQIFKTGLNEINQIEPTTPKNRRYDHILYRGLKLESTKTRSNVKTDHYPVLAEFSLG